MRLFVALDIPDDVRAKIREFVAKLREVCATCRWVRIEGIHNTLKFIGEVQADKKETVKLALSAVQFLAPIEIIFRGIGFFPNERRPRVLWAGIEAGKELGTLASAVESALEPLGIARETRAFTPHLTLARFDSTKGLDRLRAAIVGASPTKFGSAIAREFHLFQSVLKPGGAEYTRLATFTFAEGNSR